MDGVLTPKNHLYWLLLALSCLGRVDFSVPSLHVGKLQEHWLLPALFMTDPELVKYEAPSPPIECNVFGGGTWEDRIHPQNWFGSLGSTLQYFGEHDYWRKLLLLVTTTRWDFAVVMVIVHLYSHPVSAFVDFATGPLTTPSIVYQHCGWKDIFEVTNLSEVSNENFVEPWNLLLCVCAYIPVSCSS